MPQNPYFQQIAEAPNFFAGTPIMPSQMMNLSGVPGMSGTTGMMAQMFLQPLLQQMSGRAGYVPLQFQPTQGAYDHLTANMVFRERMRTMQLASDQDQQTFYKMFRGVSHLTGTHFGQEQRSAARSMAKDMAGMAPFIAQVAPDFLDRISGARGSATVMSQFMSMGLRYAKDPITGLTGSSGETAGGIASRVFENLYGKNLNLGEVASRTRGMSAGRMGQMFEELQRRGYMGADLGAQDTRRIEASTAAELLADPVGFASRGHSVDQVNDKKLTNLNADRISSRLKEMSGAVGAMREIFGDMGNPDAPIAELINGLEALTQGGLASMSGGELEMTVRNIHALVKNSGMTMDGMVQLMAGGAKIADQLGLNAEFAVHASKASAGFSAAFAQNGGGHLSGYGSLDRGRVTQLDQQMRLNAADSFQANVLNAVLGLDAAGMISKGSKGAALAAQIKAGTLANALNVEDYFDIMANSGVGRDMALQGLHNNEVNKEYGLQYKTGNLVRKFQPDEMRALMRGLYAPTATTALSRAMQEKLGAGGMANLHEGLADILQMTPEQQQSGQTRLNATIDMMYNRLTEDQRAVLGGSEEAQRAALKPVAFTYLGNVTQAVRTDPNLKHFSSLRGLLQLMNKDTLEGGESFEREQNVHAQLSRALAPFNLSPVSRRLAEAVMNAKPDANMGQLLSEIMGAAPALPGISPDGAANLQGQLGTLFNKDMRFDPVTGELVPTDGTGTGVNFRDALSSFRKDPSRLNEKMIAAHIKRVLPGIQEAFRGAGLPLSGEDTGFPDTEAAAAAAALLGGGVNPLSQAAIAATLKKSKNASGVGGPTSANTSTNLQTVQLSAETIRTLGEALQKSAEVASGHAAGAGNTTVELKDIEIVLRDERTVLNALATLVSRGSVRPPARSGVGATRG